MSALVTETTRFGRLYLGNKMVGIRQFNFPWFIETAEALRDVPGVAEVFNPAERDMRAGFYPDPDCEGTLEELKDLDFSRREALHADWDWIARYSEGMVVGPAWLKSTGTISEVACHQALGLPVWESRIFLGTAKLLPGERSWDSLLDPSWQVPPFGMLLS